MRFAAVMPPSAVHLLPQQMYNLCFAEFVLDYPGYADWFKHQLELGAIVILDTMVHEQAYGVSDATAALAAHQKRCQAALDAARILQPTIMSVPDLPSNLKATMDSFYTMMAHQYAFPRTRLMCAVQGANLAEHYECARLIAHAHNNPDGLPYIGIPLHLDHGAGYGYTVGRYRFYLQCKLDGLIPQNTQVHFLGSAPGFLSAYDARLNPNIMGVDSAKPVYLGLAGKRLIRSADGTGTLWPDPELHRPATYFNMSVDRVIQAWPDIEHNIRYLNNMLAGALE